jgi:chromosome partitioning protein
MRPSPLSGPLPPESNENLTTADLQVLAQLCVPGTDTQQNTSPPRLFSTWEITRYMIPVAIGHFRRVLRGAPHLPQGISDVEGGAKWFSFAEVQTLRAHFAAVGGKAGGRGKSYLPLRPEGSSRVGPEGSSRVGPEGSSRVGPKGSSRAGPEGSSRAGPEGGANAPVITRIITPVITLANAAAGSGKTTACLHLALAALLEGYRVLVIDLDPQARLTRQLAPPHTPLPDAGILPALARHYAEHLQAENRVRLSLGQPPLPLDETLAKALTTSLADLVTASRWPGLDLLGAALPLAGAEAEMTVWASTARGWQPHSALRTRLDRDGLLARYDLVFIDTGPGFGPLPQTALGAADLVVVPSGAQAIDAANTAAFLSLFAASFARLEAARNRTARALGEAQTRFEWSGLRVVITRYDDKADATAAAALQARLGDRVLPHRMALSPLITPQTPAVYDVDYRDHNRDTYARARESFDAVWADLRALLPGIWQHQAGVQVAAQAGGGQISNSL